jgi:hypothetical protein
MPCSVVVGGVAGRDVRAMAAASAACAGSSLFGCLPMTRQRDVFFFSLSGKRDVVWVDGGLAKNYNEACLPCLQLQVHVFTPGIP